MAARVSDFFFSKNPNLKKNFLFFFFLGGGGGAMVGEWEARVSNFVY